MVTFSLCMIVKNESAVLARMLDSVAGLMDEIIIVDTGSTDDTRAIAARYTDKIYDFEWVDDFAAARNFSFSKATCDYIYAPDADEYVDPENLERFRVLKECMLTEIDIVQMHYITKAEFNTVENLSDELRPKLFKRLREFVWTDPIHETVRLTPVVYDSDVCIQHLPQNAHHDRDFGIFLKALKRDGNLSHRIGKMWAKELLKCGNLEDLADAEEYFSGLYYAKDECNIRDEAGCVLARLFRNAGRIPEFFSVVLSHIVARNATDTCSEICYEIGMYFLEAGQKDDAMMWFYNAVRETEPILDIGVCRDSALKLSHIYEDMGLTEESLEYQKTAAGYEL